MTTEITLRSYVGQPFRPCCTPCGRLLSEQRSRRASVKRSLGKLYRPPSVFSWSLDDPGSMKRVPVLDAGSCIPLERGALRIVEPSGRAAAYGMAPYGWSFRLLRCFHGRDWRLGSGRFSSLFQSLALTMPVYWYAVERECSTKLV